MYHRTSLTNENFKRLDISMYRIYSFIFFEKIQCKRIAQGFF